MRDEPSFAGCFSAAVRTDDQLSALCEFVGQNPDIRLMRVLPDADLLLRSPQALQKCREIRRALPGAECVIALPPILRKSNDKFLSRIAKLAGDRELFSGVMTGNLEGLGYFWQREDCGKLYADANLYLWNSAAVSLWDGLLAGACLPLELTAGEQHALIRKTAENTKEKAGACAQEAQREGMQTPFFWEKLIYGRIPMMVTANCVAKTAGQCKKGEGREGIFEITDRLGKRFPVLLCCRHCLNILYNTVPLSLHEKTDSWKGEALMRLQFTLEGTRDTKEILRFFTTRDGRASGRPFSEYTTGHEKRGVQ